MRIRSIHPEFWRSEDVAALDWPTRLLFIGLWSYVDDNGVGRDVPKLITSELFPLEDDPRDTLATVSRGLQTLSDGGQIVRYTVDGKPYLALTGWSKWQRIDRPGKSRYPRPDQGVHGTLATPSRHPIDMSPPGEGEKGRRGEGEKGLRSSPAVPQEGAPRPRNSRGRFVGGEWANDLRCGTHPENELSPRGVCRACAADKLAAPKEIA